MALVAAIRPPFYHIYAAGFTPWSALVYANRVLLEMLENGDETFFLDEESDEIEN